MPKDNDSRIALAPLEPMLHRCRLRCVRLGPRKPGLPDALPGMGLDIRGASLVHRPWYSARNLARARPPPSPTVPAKGRGEQVLLPDIVSGRDEGSTSYVEDEAEA